MNQFTGTKIHHSNLVPGQRYFLSHRNLGQAVVVFNGENQFTIEEGSLQSRGLNKKFGKGETYELPETMWDMVVFHEPI